MNTPSPVAFHRDQAIGVIEIDHPPVNALSLAVIAALDEAVAGFEADRSLQALVLCCAGRTFVAGGDIADFDAPSYSTAPFNHLLARLQAQDRPVVAALHGTVLGGGLELAMACHYRIAAPGTRLGMPEVRLGVLPGTWGTQGLAWLVPVPMALEMLLSGRPIAAAEAVAAGLVDTLVDGAPKAAGLAQARELLARGAGPRRTGERTIDTAALPADLFAKAYAGVEPQAAIYPAPLAIVRCVEAGVRHGFDAQRPLEAELFEQCRRSRAARSLQHLFFAEREAAKIPGLPRETPRRAIARIGVVGAGTMGGGIAMTFANAGFPVVLVDNDAEALARGLATVRRNYDASAARGRLTAAEVDERMARLAGSLDDAALADCDLVIEAVFEDLALKQRVMARLGRVCRPGAILASNTSTLDVDALAAASGRPRDVLGMHFFSPAHVMRLLEVVRGARTDPAVLATVMDLARRVGKTAVVAGVCYGFIGNRMLAQYMRQNDYLLMEGATPAQIDAAVEDPHRLGMAMGPCRMMDMAGVDVGARTTLERRKSGNLPDEPGYRAVTVRLAELGRLGQKSGAGHYRYEGRTPLPDPALDSVLEALAREHGITRRADIGAAEIVERLLLPMINEAARILEEGIAQRPGDIDVVWTAGYGFPDHRGGPLFMADEIGLAHVVERLQHHGRMRGNALGHWTPAPLLLSLVKRGQRLSDWRP